MRARVGEPAWELLTIKATGRAIAMEAQLVEKKAKARYLLAREREREARRQLSKSLLRAHSTTERDLEAKTAVCAICGPTTLKLKNRKTYVCVRSGRGRRHREVAAQFRGDHCEACGLVPEDPSALETDHADGDWQNNARPNLWTLCGSCHNIKTAWEAGRIRVGSGVLPKVIVALVARGTPVDLRPAREMVG